MKVRTFLLLVGVGSIVFLTLVGLGVYFIAQPPKPLPPREADGQGRLDVIEAFKNPGAQPASKDFKEFFEDFGKCLKNGGADGHRYWDLERLAREMDRDGDLRRAGVRPTDRSFIAGMREAMQQRMANWSKLLGYDSTEIRGVREIVPEREAVVITRHTAMTDEGLVRFKMRWWLIKDQGWRVYDLEDMAVGGRITVLAGSIVAEASRKGQAEFQRFQQKARRFQEAQTALLTGEYETAEKVLSDPDLETMPGALRPILHVWRAIASVRLGKFELALTQLTEAEKGLADSPILYLLRVTCFAAQEDWKNVLTPGKKYVELIGPDEEICVMMGNAYLGLEQYPQAAAEYGRALDDLPESLDALQGLMASLKQDDRSELAKRFARFQDPASRLAELIQHAGDDEKTVEAIIGVVREKSPNDPELLFQTGRVHLRKDRVVEATDTFRRAIDRCDAEKRMNMVRRFIWEMDGRGKGMEAYSAVADSDCELAFQTLAENLTDEGDVQPNELKVLEGLLQSHRKRKPMDAWIPYYQGELHHARRDYDQAEKAYATAMDRKLDDAMRDTFRWARVQNLIDAKRFGDAYMSVGPRRETFAQLASGLSDETDHDVLARLIWIHSQAEPGDPALALWRGDLLFRKGKYESALVELRAYRAGLGDQHKPHLWKVEDQIVRSLLRLNRYAEARKELGEPGPGRFVDRVLETAIVAASGDVAKTEKLMEELIKQQHVTIGRFYADPDLGPILKTPPFKKLLEKYPPPKVEGNKL